MFGDLDDPNSEVAKLNATAKVEALHPEYGMNEKVKYIGLPKKFVAGTVIFGDIDECAKDVTVTIAGNGTKAETKTNGFGDFEFDGLADNTEYTVKVEAAGYNAKSVKAKTMKDLYLGEIVLKK